jgi:hypothetical protein
VGTFSLLQVSLDQEIDRHSLEDASMAVPSVARADCARLQRELFGIVISGLQHQEALAFQTELARRGFSTEMVADSELPVLHESFQIQRIEHRDEVLVLTDSMGRERVRPLSDLVFLSAGLVNRLDFKTETRQFLDFSGPRGGAPSVVTERKLVEEKELWFRLDFFFWSGPNRMHAALGKGNVLFHQDKPLRLKDEAALRELLVSMASLLPVERLNSCLSEPRSIRVYPNLQCYEEEIRWHFRRLKPRG